MTTFQKERVAELRSRGESYAKIAAAIGLSENTVKSFCQRNKLGGKQSFDGNPSEKTTYDSTEGTYCRQCGKALVQQPGKKKLLFCSKDCRAAWWASHPDSLNRKAVYKFVCPRCGASFTAYGNSRRKYCSHACYIAARFGKGAAI